MRLTRIYQPQAAHSGQIVNLSKEASGHLIRVLRMQVNDKFIVFNGEAGEFHATIIELTKSTVTVKLGEFNAVNRESPLPMTLAQAVLRSEKMDYMLQKAVELGVSRFMSPCGIGLTPSPLGEHFSIVQGCTEKVVTAYMI